MKQKIIFLFKILFVLTGLCLALYCIISDSESEWALPLAYLSVVCANGIKLLEKRKK